MFYLMIVVFILGYAVIALEHPLRVNKSATALLLAVAMWVLFVIGGGEHVYTVPVAVPANAPQTLTLLVADSATMVQWDQRELRAAQRPQSVAQIIDTLNRQRRSNQLYVRLLASEAGAVVAGQPMPALPPSVLSVLEADGAGGAFARLSRAVIGAWDVSTDHAVSGSRTIDVTLEPGRP